MAFDVVAYAQFLERREQRRTADRGRAFPGAAATAATPVGGGTVIDGERSDARRPPAPAAGPVAAAVAARPRKPRPVPRWSARRPAPDR